MTLIDLIGFVISLLALAFLFFRNGYQSRMTVEELNELEKAENELPRDHPMQDFLNALEGRLAEEEHAHLKPLPSPKVPFEPLKLKLPPLTSSVPRKDEKIIEEPSKNTRALFEGIDDPIKMLIYYEIMHKPKSQKTRHR